MRLEYVPGAGGAALVHNLQDTEALAHEALLAARPIRQPKSYKGQWSKPGWYWMASVGRHVSYESKFERSFLMEVDFEGTVTEVVPQPFRLHFERMERPYRHTPDFLVGRRGDVPELVDVKGARARENPVNRLTFTLTERACQRLGLSFTVYTEPDRVWQENLAFVAGYRSPRMAVLDAHLPALVDVLAPGALSFAEAVEGLSDRGILTPVTAAVVWRAVWKRLVTVPMRSALLGMDSVIDLPDPDESGTAVRGAA